MTLHLYGHPFSAYHQKVTTAFYEYELPFTLRSLNDGDDSAENEFNELWPIRMMPLLLDEGRTVAESSVIIEYLGRYRGSHPALIPADADAALQVRFMDRFFDNYVMTPMQRIVFDYLRAPEQRDALSVSEARERLERSYRWLDAQLEKGGPWAAGDSFSLADCAAAPSLFYADWVHPIPQELEHARAYRARLLARPSFARAVEEGRRFRSYFPPGAPDRD